MSEYKYKERVMHVKSLVDDCFRLYYLCFYKIEKSGKGYQVYSMYYLNQMLIIKICILFDDNSAHSLKKLMNVSKPIPANKDALDYFNTTIQGYGEMIATFKDLRDKTFAHLDTTRISHWYHLHEIEDLLKLIDFLLQQIHGKKPFNKAEFIENLN